MVWYKLRQALVIFLQIVNAINKVQLCCSIFSIKTSSKLVSSVRELVLLFDDFFVSFCAFGCLIFLPFVCETILIMWNVKRGFCFATAFHCCLLIPQSVFCSVFHRRSFHPYYCHDHSHCVHLNVFQIGRFLLPLSPPWSIFHPKVTQWLTKWKAWLLCRSVLKLLMVI